MLNDAGRCGFPAAITNIVLQLSMATLILSAPPMTPAANSMRLKKNTPLRKPLVVVAHTWADPSPTLCLPDAGTTLWLEAFGHPPAQTPMDAKSKHLLEEVLIFEHRRDIGRVVFMSTPHRGSDLASNWIGRIGSMIVKTPSKLIAIGQTVRENLTADPSALKLKRLPNSVDTLAPNNRFVVAINKIPMTKTIPYHSIIGDRGRGDTPNSSDGVVAYWSSHLDGARANVSSRAATDRRSIPKRSPRSIVYLNSTPSPIGPNQSNLLLQDTHRRAGFAVMEMLHLAQQRFQKPICRAFSVKRNRRVSGRRLIQTPYNWAKKE